MISLIYMKVSFDKYIYIFVHGEVGRFQGDV